MFLKKAMKIFQKNEISSSNSDDYLTSQSNFDDSKNSKSSNRYENKAFDETFDRNKNDSFNASQSTFKRPITLSSSSFNRITRNNRDEAFKSNYTNLHKFRKRTRNST